MKPIVTNGIEQAIKEFKDTYPNSNDLNLMINTKKASLEADMDSKKDLMISMLDRKAREASASLIATKVAHTQILTRIKEDVENEAREVAYGLKNKCNASIKRAT